MGTPKLKPHDPAKPVPGYGPKLPGKPTERTLKEIEDYKRSQNR